VFAIAANVAYRYLRDEVRRKSAYERLARLPAETAGRPDESLEREKLLHAVKNAVSALPHNHRVALVMCDLEGIPGRDAAEALAIPEGTLYRRVHEARRALRELFEEGRL
jgi:RNA polymerase sigma-70 factor (ECF subfamily)